MDSRWALDRRRGSPRRPQLSQAWEAWQFAYEEAREKRRHAEEVRGRALIRLANRALVSAIATWAEQTRQGRGARAICARIFKREMYTCYSAWKGYTAKSNQARTHCPRALSARTVRTLCSHALSARTHCPCALSARTVRGAVRTLCPQALSARTVRTHCPHALSARTVRTHCPHAACC